MIRVICHHCGYEDGWHENWNNTPKTLMTLIGEFWYCLGCREKLGLK